MLSIVLVSVTICFTIMVLNHTLNGYQNLQLLHSLSLQYTSVGMFLLIVCICCIWTLFLGQNSLLLHSVIHDMLPSLPPWYRALHAKFCTSHTLCKFLLLITSMTVAFMSLASCAYIFLFTSVPAYLQHQKSGKSCLLVKLMDMAHACKTQCQSRQQCGPLVHI